LSEPYIAEAKYNEMSGSEIPIDLPTFAPKETATSEGTHDLGAIDEKKVLEVLQKDLGG